MPLQAKNRGLTERVDASGHEIYCMHEVRNRYDEYADTNMRHNSHAQARKEEEPVCMSEQSVKKRRRTKDQLWFSNFEQWVDGILFLSCIDSTSL